MATTAATIELVLPIESKVPSMIPEEAAKLAAKIIKMIDRVENIWDGPGGVESAKSAVQTIIGLSRTRAIRWLDTISITKTQSKEEQIPSQDPSCKVASVGNGNSNNPIKYTASRIHAIIVANVMLVFSKQGTGGLKVEDVPMAKLLVNLAFQHVKDKYGCGEGIIHTDTTKW